MAGGPLDSAKFKEQLSSINMGSVMAAAARDYQKEILGTGPSNRGSRPEAWSEFDLDSLAEDPELERLHAQRLAEMRREGEKRAALQQKGHGEYREITEEKFLEEVTGSEKVVTHFFHKEFTRCKIMDKHLLSLTTKYLDTKFIRIDAERCPFFVDKLAIKVLPCVILFRNGVAVDRIIGFHELGGKDDFATSSLESRLEKQGLIIPKVVAQGSVYSKPNLRSSIQSDSDSDFD